MISNLKIERVYDSFFKMDKVTFDQKRFDGGVISGVVREVFVRKPVVFLSLFDPKANKFLFVEQVRVGAIVSEETNQDTVLEPVAGIIDDGETPLQAAVREAQEETNLEVDVDSICIVQEGFTSPGGSSEYAYFATGLFDSSNYKEQTGGVEGEQEDIRTHLIDGDVVMDLIANGTVNSLSGSFGVYWHKVHS